MTAGTIVGLVAGTLTTASWVPQIRRVLRLRRAEEISWSFLAVLSAGISGWLAYGILVPSLSVVLANAVTLAFLLLMLGVKIWSTRRASSDVPGALDTDDAPTTAARASPSP